MIKFFFELENAAEAVILSHAVVVVGKWVGGWWIGVHRPPQQKIDSYLATTTMTR